MQDPGILPVIWSPYFEFNISSQVNKANFKENTEFSFYREKNMVKTSILGKLVT